MSAAGGGSLLPPALHRRGQNRDQRAPNRSGGSAADPIIRTAPSLAAVRNRHPDVVAEEVADAQADDRQDDVKGSAVPDVQETMIVNRFSTRSCLPGGSAG